MKKPDNRFRRDLRRRPLWRRNEALGAVMADLDAHIGQILKGVSSFDPVGTFVASLARRVVAPRIAASFREALLTAVNQEELNKAAGMLTERVQSD